MSVQEKEVQWYSAAVNAWLGTRMEHDRSLLTLSGGGIAILITLMPSGIRSIEGLMVYVAAVLAFLLSIVLLLVIFKRNATYLQSAITDGVKNGDSILRYLDSAAIGCFLLGAFLSSILGISTAFHTLQNEKKPMTKEPGSLEQVITVDKTKSYDGFQNLKPPAAPEKPSTPPQDTKEKK